MLYDVFISHASEDKDTFVRPLAEALNENHISVWYDEFSLSVGDSLRESIDRGLAMSRFGIVVLSQAFFKKNWPQRELNGLVAREVSEDRKLILPIWHGVSHSDVTGYSPPLGDTVALNSADGIASIVRALLETILPGGSPLIVAREELRARDLVPPVISDEWWLDVVEASNRISHGGVAVPQEQVWGAWSFPLPDHDASGKSRGLRLAWTAMQMEWADYAEANKVCQITPPEIVHEFIENFEGLEEACRRYPLHLASYAPQLLIQEFSGEFERCFDEQLQESYRESAEEAEHSPNAGIALTTNGKPPICEIEWALRDPMLGCYRPMHLAKFYVMGEMFGVSSRQYEVFDYLTWFLSGRSKWLPETIREALIDGMRTWTAWAQELEIYSSDFGDRLYTARSAKTFKYTKRIRTSLQELIELSLARLSIETNPVPIVEGFIDRDIVGGWFEMREAQRRRR